jgi:hypothetical protein
MSFNAAAVFIDDSRKLQDGCGWNVCIVSWLPGKDSIHCCICSAACSSNLQIVRVAVQNAWRDYLVPRLQERWRSSMACPVNRVIMLTFAQCLWLSQW